MSAKPHQKQTAAGFSSEPFDVDYYEGLSQKYLNECRWDKAIEVLSHLLKHQGPNEGNLLALAKAYQMMEMPDIATDRLEQILEVDPKSISARVHLGIIAKTQFQFLHAEAYLRDALSLEPQSVNIWIELIRLFIMGEHWDEAQKACEQANMLSPTHPVVACLSGELWDALGETQKAEEDYRHAVDLLELHPTIQRDDRVWVFNQFAKFLEKQEKLEEALTYYTFSLKVQPEQVRTHQKMGVLQAGFARFKEALNHHRRVIELDPDNARNYYELGQLYYHLGNLEASNESFRQAIDLAPRMTDAYYELGANYYELEDYGAAKVLFKKAIVLEPDYDLPYYSLGLICLAENEAHVAEYLYQHLVNMQSSWAKALMRHIQSSKS